MGEEEEKKKKKSQVSRKRNIVYLLIALRAAYSALVSNRVGGGSLRCACSTATSLATLALAFKRSKESSVAEKSTAKRVDIFAS